MKKKTGSTMKKHWKFGIDQTGVPALPAPTGAGCAGEAGPAQAGAVKTTALIFHLLPIKEKQNQPTTDL